MKVESEAKKAAKQASKSQSKQVIATKSKKQHVVVRVDHGGWCSQGGKSVSARTTRTRVVVLPPRYCETS